jgi:hypothetical protein
MSGCANIDSSGQRASIPASVKTSESNVARQGYFYVAAATSASRAARRWSARCTWKFGRRAKCVIHGNGHGIPSELNSLDVAVFVNKWLEEHVR